MLEDVMGVVYHKLQEQPENEEYRNLLGSLGTVAEGMLSQQIDFTYVYCSPDVKDSVIENLEGRKESLVSALKIDLEEKTR
jgi:hypothetical protein